MIFHKTINIFCWDAIKYPILSISSLYIKCCTTFTRTFINCIFFNLIFKRRNYRFYLFPDRNNVFNNFHLQYSFKPNIEYFLNKINVFKFSIMPNSTRKASAYEECISNWETLFLFPHTYKNLQLKSCLCNFSYWKIKLLRIFF